MLKSERFRHVLNAFILALLCTTVQLTSGSPFYDLNYDQIVDKLNDFAGRYPKLVRVDTGSERYGIKFPPSIPDCSAKYGACDVYIITLTNHETWEGGRLSKQAKKQSDAPRKGRSRRPHVYLSGALHGNERVGPTAVMAAIRLLIEGYLNGQPWAVKMLDSRVVIATPMTNADGYAHSKREENGIDPNRDFTYDLSSHHSSTLCMRTLCARVVNELFREHLIQMSVTFHGGMRAIAYEWGGPNHPTPQDKSPDHAAQSELAAMLQYVSGTLALGEHNYPETISDASSKKWWYPKATLNKLVYPVKGGMEDWAYSGSWERKGGRNVNTRCAPNTYGGYPVDKTEYNDAQLRSFNFLIETSDKKIPSKGWGKISNNAWWNDILRVNDIETDGHVPRNARVALFLISMVQPYVVLQKASMSIESERMLHIEAVVGGCNTLDAWMLESYDSDQEWINLANSQDAMNHDSSGVPSYLSQFAINDRHLLDADSQEYQYSIPLNIDIELNDQIIEQSGLVDNESKVKVRLSVACDGNWYRNTLTGKNTKVASVPSEVTVPQSHIVNARHPRVNEEGNVISIQRHNGVFAVESRRYWPSEEYFVLVNRNQQIDVDGSGIQKSMISDFIRDEEGKQDLHILSMMKNRVNTGESSSSRVGSLIDRLLGNEKSAELGSVGKRDDYSEMKSIVSRTEEEQKNALSRLFQWEMAGVLLIFVVMAFYCFKASQSGRNDKHRHSSSSSLSRSSRSQRRWLEMI